MPTGRPLKPPGQAVTRHRPTYGWVEVPAVPFAGRPMPRRPGGGAWPAGAARLWRAWSRMPHAALWGESDWVYASESLLVAARFYEGESAAAASELRLREQAMGCTWGSRQSLRLKYVEPESDTDTADAGSISRLADYRNL